jgi:hypothetical protein
MLKHLGCSQNNDAILGDLLEQYQQGQSRLWYCKQAFSTILVSFFKDLWEHKGLACLSILAGIACLQLWSLFGLLLPRPETVGIMVIQQPWRIIPEGNDIVAFALTGWVLARFAGEQRKMAVFAFSGFFLLYGIITPWFAASADPVNPGTLALNFIIAYAVNALGLFGGGGLLPNPRR